MEQNTPPNRLGLTQPSEDLGAKSRARWTILAGAAVIVLGFFLKRHVHLAAYCLMAVGGFLAGHGFSRVRQATVHTAISQGTPDGETTIQDRQ